MWPPTPVFLPGESHGQRSREGPAWSHRESDRTEQLSLSLGISMKEMNTLRETQGLPWWFRGQSVCPQCGGPGFDPWVRKIPWRRKWQPTPVFLPGESHGWRSLLGYSPRGHKESDTTEPPGKPLHFTLPLGYWHNTLPLSHSAEHGNGEGPEMAPT